MDSFWSSVHPLLQKSRTKFSSNSRQPTRSRCASLLKGINVLPRVQNAGDRTAASMGNDISAGALRVDVLLQLLVGLARADHRPFVESQQLPRVAAQTGLLGNA